jgi:TolB protein
MMLRTIPFAVALAGLALITVPKGWSTVDAMANAMVVTSADLQQDPPPIIDLRGAGAAGARRRIAIPEFTSGAGATAEIQTAARTISEVLWDDIAFEREVYVLPKVEAAKVPAADSLATLPYDRWSELGVDVVVLGKVAADPTRGLAVTVQMIGIRGDLKGQQVFGKIYGCGARNPRYCAHFIADEFHKSQGIDGVARTRLAFASDRSSEIVPGRLNNNPAQEMYIADYDGANVSRVTVNRNLTIQPSWSPDGRFLAYSSYATGFPDVYVHNIYEYGRPARPAAGTESIKNSMPAWSPDGTKIAYTSIRGGEPQIWVVNRDGSNPRQLTNNRLASFAPAWSPSGAQIVFVSDRAGAGNSQLYLMGSDGAGVQYISCGQANCDHPSWSPVSNKIAYTCGNNAAGYDVCVLDVATRAIANLTGNHNGSHEQPTFAPNGRHIVFVTTRWGKKQLAMVDVTGELHDRRVTNTGTNTYPAWSRTTQ